MSNLAKIQERRSSINQSLISVTTELLSEKSTISEVLAPCVDHLGLLLGADLITVYMDINEINLCVSQGEQMKSQQSEAEEIEQVLSQVYTWTGQQRTEQNEHDLSIVELDQFSNRVSQERKIIITKEKIYIPLLKAPKNEKNIFHYSKGELVQREEAGSLTVIDLLPEPSSCQEQPEPDNPHKSLGVICIKRQNQNKTTTTSYDEINAIKQISLLASVGLKHVRLLRNLELSQASDEIRKSVLTFLANPCFDEIDRVYNHVQQLYYDDNIEAIKISGLDGIGFAALEKSEDGLLFFAIRMVRGKFFSFLKNRKKDLRGGHY